MSKKHFIALADALRGTRPSQRDIEMLTGEYQQWKRDRDAIAQICILSNAYFKLDRWLDYIDGKCGPNGGHVTKLHNLKH